MEMFEKFNRPIEVYIARALFGAFLFFAVLGSFYTVNSTEEATVQRFGRYIGTVGPGLHFKVPFFTAVSTTEVTTIHRLEIGFNTESTNNGTQQYSTNLDESEMLTGDDNIVNLDFVVQYRSADAMKWQFRIIEPEAALKLMSESAVRLVVGRSTFDRVITIGKEQVQAEAKQVLQAYVNQLDLGIQIVSIQLQDVLPPKDVAPAFKDVATAREDSDKAIQEAKKHMQRVLPETRGQAVQIVKDAEGYAATRVNAAKGDVARFNEVLAKYVSAPEVTRDRLILETQEQIFRGQTIIVDQSSGSLLKLFDVNKTQGAAQ